MYKGDVLESGFLSFILGMPLVLNTADKVAVRGQNNSKASYDFTFSIIIYSKRGKTPHALIIVYT